MLGTPKWVMLDHFGSTKYFKFDTMEQSIQEHFGIF